jgi:hypothetical protein
VPLPAVEPAGGAAPLGPGDLSQGVPQGRADVVDLDLDLDLDLVKDDVADKPIVPQNSRSEVPSKELQDPSTSLTATGCRTPPIFKAWGASDLAALNCG